jgi:phosphoribosylformimino-5-aminoimidazole carboxamide ribotide isomerase
LPIPPRKELEDWREINKKLFRAMRIIPAIDIIDGKCVRLTQGDYDQKKIYNESPVEVAKMFEDAGIKHLHLVDLDGAKAGKVINYSTIESVCGNTNLHIDFGGGIKTTEELQTVLGLGVKQITAGSIAVKNPELVTDWLSRFGGEKVILGADVQDGKIAIGGWQETTAVCIEDFIQHFMDKGIQSVISTDIATDGMLSGPSIELYRKLVNRFPDLDIIASGGVSSMDDLESLKQTAVKGVIIGKAIYENKISLKDLEVYAS